jgi:hypothetical protein
MSPPQPQFIDLSIRDSGPVAQGAPLDEEIAAFVSTTSAELYGRTAKVLRLHSLPRPVPIDRESGRWFEFLDSLKARAEIGMVTQAQRTKLLAVWDRALGRQPSLRRPAVGMSDDGSLRVSWSFADLPGRVFTLDLHRDGSVDWFYRDQSSGLVTGTDDEPATDLPEDAVLLLANGFSGPR